MFRGANNLNLDGKGRMVMPTCYREELREICENRLIVTIDKRKCLLIYPLQEWERVEGDLSGVPNLSEPVRDLQEFMVGFAHPVEMDRHGRLALPQFHRGFAGLDHEVVLIGQRTRFELWDDARFKARLESWVQSESPVAAVPPELGSLRL